MARYAKLGLAGMHKDAPRRGRPHKVDAQRVVHLACIWRAHGLKPHLSHTFKVSNDIRFEEKLTDVVGLYMSPPERAVVLCCDQKSQVQALDRTQPGLPLKRGRAQTMTHDYKRTCTSPPPALHG